MSQLLRRGVVLTGLAKVVPWKLLIRRRKKKNLWVNFGGRFPLYSLALFLFLFLFLFCFQQLTSNHLDIPYSLQDEVYCICGGRSYGKMIACENPDCRMKWFHFACVNLTPSTKPTGKWSNFVHIRISSFAGLHLLFMLLGIVLSVQRAEAGEVRKQDLANRKLTKIWLSKPFANLPRKRRAGLRCVKWRKSDNLVWFVDVIIVLLAGHFQRNLRHDRETPLEISQLEIGEVRSNQSFSLAIGAHSTRCAHLL